MTHLTPPSYDQDGWRFRDGVPDPSGVNASFDGSDTAANTDVSLDVDTLYRVRILVKQTDAVADDTDNLATEFRLQYNNTTQVSGWVNVGNEGEGSEDVEFITPTGFTEGDNTDTQLLGGGSYVSGVGNYDSASGTVTFTTSATSETELEFAFTINSGQVANNDLIDLRVVYSNANESPPATALAAYTAIPTITVVEAAAPQTLTQTTWDASPTFGAHDISTTLGQTTWDASPTFGAHSIGGTDLTATAPADFSPVFAIAPGAYNGTEVELTLTCGSVLDASPTFNGARIGDLIADVADLGMSADGHELVGGVGRATFSTLQAERVVTQLPQNPRYRAERTGRAAHYDRRQREDFERNLLGLPSLAPEGSIPVYMSGEWRLFEPNAPHGYVLTVTDGQLRWNSVSAITKTTSDYTLTESDFMVWVDASTGDVTITLPSTLVTGRRYEVKRIDTSLNSVTIDPGAAQLEGMAAVLDVLPAESFTLGTDGTEWRIV